MYTRISMMQNRQIGIREIPSQIFLCSLGQNSDVPSTFPHRGKPYEL